MAKKSAAKKSASRSNAGVSLATSETAKQAASFVDGLDTSDLPDTMIPELRLDDGGMALIRFVKFEWQPTGKMSIAQRGMVHSLSVNSEKNKFPKVTCMGEGCPLCMTGDQPSPLFFMLGLLRAVKQTSAEKQKYAEKQVGKVLLMKHGKKAVNFINKEVLPKLAGRDLSEVDIVWKRHGSGFDTMHIFDIYPKKKPLTPGEIKAIKAGAELNVWDVARPRSKQYIQVFASKIGGMAMAEGDPLPSDLPDGDPASAGSSSDIDFGS